LEIEVTAPGKVGQVVIYTIRAHKSPGKSDRCLPPGASAASACA
jgi:hypothetical protein